jgi:hypothetical protein
MRALGVPWRREASATAIYKAYVQQGDGYSHSRSRCASVDAAGLSGP